MNELFSLLIRDYESQLDNETFSDLTFIAGERRIHAHRVILAGSSPKIDAMLEPIATTPKQIIKIDDIEPEVLFEMLRYIYSGNAREFARLGETLLIAAKKCGLVNLCELCEDRLAVGVKVDNAARLLKFAREHGSEFFKKHVQEFIEEHAKEVSETDEFRTLDVNVLREMFVDVAKKFVKSNVRGTILTSEIRIKSPSSDSS